MVFYMIGLGLGDEKDITVKGLEIIKSCDEIYLEHYTSILGVEKEKLENFYGRQLIMADREMCEEGIDKILEDLSKIPEKNIAFLVVGDPFCATTHSDTYLRAIELGIKVEVIHNASIINAIGSTGMQVYRFGEIVSIPFYTEKWRPYSFYDKISANIKHGLHTLCLLDIRVKERTDENILKNKKIYEPPKYMSCQVAIEQILEAESVNKTGSVNKNTKCVAVARVGFSNQLIKAGTLEEFLTYDMGGPLHSLVICANELHPIENDMFKYFSKK
ncbi:hypothetical protein IMG5_013440 [Ichthyophthirius multifiliis]|uniref:diphthine methyl ester synthase n=1 Tax=Ichthyophthirius multifiliis TaxID=5932 RepID=G0QK62_ICHMU|nr:hypothetical protein IMG5_013440 [Ichthyophthirius multifiliis]EGR34393.1 hypothetical protein IMG5_013440 [Ichthyophthirius multifiliis]|eukprot:XP_004039697.1 hypothetical protein IMG5_013440 [Ichthyophthirius multifiliis]